MYDIEKIKYTTSMFDIENMHPSDSNVFELLSDGSVLYKRYEYKTCRCLEKKSFTKKRIQYIIDRNRRMHFFG